MSNTEKKLGDVTRPNNEDMFNSAIAIPSDLISPADGREFHIRRWEPVVALGEAVSVKIEAIIKTPTEKVGSGTKRKKMTWIDIKQRRPTKEDADSYGNVLWQYSDGSVGAYAVDHKAETLVAWMPIPPYTPLPEIPTGYRMLKADEYKQKQHPKAMFLVGSDWRLIGSVGQFYCTNDTYIVPIEPQCRPFKNADEFKPYRHRWWRVKEDKTNKCIPPLGYSDEGYGTVWTWEGAFQKLEFDGGIPFGIQAD